MNPAEKKNAELFERVSAVEKGALVTALFNFFPTSKMEEFVEFLADEGVVEWKEKEEEEEDPVSVCPKCYEKYIEEIKDGVDAGSNIKKLDLDKLFEWQKIFPQSGCEGCGCRAFGTYWTNY